MTSKIFIALFCAGILSNVICAPASQVSIHDDVTKAEVNTRPLNETAVKTMIGLKFWDHIYTEVRPKWIFSYWSSLNPYSYLKIRLKFEASEEKKRNHWSGAHGRELWSLCGWRSGRKDGSSQNRTARKSSSHHGYGASKNRINSVYTLLHN